MCRQPVGAPTPANRQALLTIKPVDPVQARGLAFPPQQHKQPPIAETTPLVSQLAQPAPQGRIIRPAGAIADRGAIHSDEGTGPPFRQAKAGLQVRDGFALSGGPYHFFESSSRKAEASSIVSASSFFSLAFSSSSAFNRLASETSMPPNLAFQLYRVASDMPCLRHRSAAFAPPPAPAKSQ